MQKLYRNSHFCVYIQFYWNTVMTIYFHFVYGYFWLLWQSGIIVTDTMWQQSLINLLSGPLQETFLTPGLDCEVIPLHLMGVRCLYI